MGGRRGRAAKRQARVAHAVESHVEEQRNMTARGVASFVRSSAAGEADTGAISAAPEGAAAAEARRRAREAAKEHVHELMARAWKLHDGDDPERADLAWEQCMKAAAEARQLQHYTAAATALATALIRRGELRRGICHLAQGIQALESTRAEEGESEGGPHDSTLTQLHGLIAKTYARVGSQTEARCHLERRGQLLGEADSSAGGHLAAATSARSSPDQAARAQRIAALTAAPTPKVKASVQSAVVAAMRGSPACADFLLDGAAAEQKELASLGASRRAQVASTLSVALCTPHEGTGGTLLMALAARNQLARLKRLLLLLHPGGAGEPRDTWLDRRDAQGNTALYWALAWAAPQCAATLRSVGATFGGGVPTPAAVAQWKDPRSRELGAQWARADAVQALRARGEQVPPPSPVSGPGSRSTAGVVPVEAGLAPLPAAVPTSVPAPAPAQSSEPGPTLAHTGTSAAPAPTPAPQPARGEGATPTPSVHRLLGVGAAAAQEEDVLHAVRAQVAEAMAALDGLGGDTAQ